MAIDRAPTPAEKAWASTTLVVVLCETGDVVEAIKYLEKLTPQFQEAGLVPFKVATTAYTGVAHALVGNTEKALSFTRTAMEQAERFGMTLYTGIANQTMAGSVKNRDLDQARKHLHHAISAFRDIDARRHLAAAFSELGRFEKERGRIKNAKDHFEEALFLFSKIDHLTEPDRSQAELKHLPDH